MLPAPVPSVPVPGAAPSSPEDTEGASGGSDDESADRPSGGTGTLAPRAAPLVDRPPSSDGASGCPSAPPTGSDPFAMAFPPGVADKLAWYVYLLVEPGSPAPFFVGRGRGNRCFDHVLAARSEPSSAPDGRVSRAEKKFRGLDRIREIEATAGPVCVEILRYGLTADEARSMEEAITDALGLTPDSKRGSQRRPAAELGIRLAKPAKFKREHPVVLLQLGAGETDLAYGTVRHGWRIGRRWSDPDAPRSPRWAVIVAGDLVAGVYRIDRWEATPLIGRADQPARPDRPDGPAEPDIGTTTRSTYRHSFIGERDEQLEDRYLGRSVAAYLGPRSGARSGTGSGGAALIGAPNQVAYVGCGPSTTLRSG